MFTKWQEVEDWIRDSGLTWWRFSYDRSGTQPTDGEGEKQTRTNRVAVLSDAYPGDVDEKIALTKKRLMSEKGQILYGQGKRGRENTGLMYCEVRLADEFQQPGTQPISAAPAIPFFDEDKITERIRKQVQLEFENQRYQEERKQFEAEKKKFEEEKNSAVGFMVHHLSPVFAAISGQKRVAGVDATVPVEAQPIRAVEADQNEEMSEIFTDKESEQLFELMARFKAVEPQYIKLIESVVVMAEKQDPTYDMAKGFLLK